MNFAIILSIALAHPPSIEAAAAAPPRIVEMSYQEGDRIVLEAVPGEVPDGAVVAYAWNIVSDDIQTLRPSELDDQLTDRWLAIWALPGRHVVFSNVFKHLPDGTVNTSVTKTWITVTPRGPPPDPAPDPDDPDTPPNPSEAPFQSPGFAVLVIHEASETGLLPASQRAIFTDSDFQRFSQKCVKIPGGDDAFFRTWDDDYSEADLQNVPQALREAYLAVRDQATILPWIAISTGDGGFSGPLPKTVQETVGLLGRYAP